jgi:hypothetical protein
LPVLPVKDAWVRGDGSIGTLIGGGWFIINATVIIRGITGSAGCVRDVVRVAAVVTGVRVVGGKHGAGE